MGGFSLAGYVLFAVRRAVEDPGIVIQFYIGILAAVAFVFGIAGSFSAVHRSSLVLSIVGAALVTCWGLLTNWYYASMVADPSEVNAGVTLGTIALFFSLLAIVLVVASKEHFKRLLL